MLKKSLVSVIFLSLSFFSNTSYSQLLNGSFESWTASGPEYWSTSSVTEVLNNVVKSSESYSGSFSAKLEIVNFFDSPMPSWLYSDYDGNAHPISEKYTQLNGYLKAILISSAQVLVNIYMYDNTMYTLGLGSTTINRSMENWTQFKIPIEYFDNKTPSFCTVQFILYDSSETKDLSTIGSFVELDNIYFDNVTSIENSEMIINNYSLEQNYPNPFNPNTTISYSVPTVNVGAENTLPTDRQFSSTTNVVLKVYDVLGKEVAALVNEQQSAGNYKVEFDASNLTNGIYFYQLTAGSFIETKKMLLLK